MRGFAIFILSLSVVVLATSRTKSSFLRKRSLLMTTRSEMPLKNAVHRTVVWFRNDLRIKDNPLLHVAATAYDSHLKAQQQQSVTSKTIQSELVCLYCFDPRYFTSTAYSPHKTGLFRTQFLLESVDALRSSLRSIGSDLFVSLDRPENIIPQLLQGSLVHGVVDSTATAALSTVTGSS